MDFGDFFSTKIKIQAKQLTIWRIISGILQGYKAKQRSCQIATNIYI